MAAAQQRKYGIFCFCITLTAQKALLNLETAFWLMTPVTTEKAHRGFTLAAVKVSGRLQGRSLLQARDRLQGPLPSCGPSRAKLPFL
jgi:hypothetical protein